MSETASIATTPTPATAPPAAATETAPPSEAAPTQTTDEQPFDLDAVWEKAKAAKRKIVVDGEEIEDTLEGHLKNTSKSKAAHKRFEEAHKLRAEVEKRETELAQTIQLLRDPRTSERALARLLGSDDALYQMAERVVVKRLELDALPEPERKRRSQMSERERAIEAEERALAQREAEIKTKRDAEVQRQAQEYQERFAREFPEHLRAAGIPPSRHAIARMASTMREALSHGVDMDAREAAQIVAEEIRAEYAAIAKDADGETLSRLLGDGAEKVRAAKLAAVQQQPGAVAPKQQPTPRAAPREASKPTTIEELRRRWSR